MQEFAIVTGHTRGLGAAVAAELLARGVRVLGLSRGAAAEAEGLTQIQIDLADANALREWLAGDALAGFARGARRVALVNNAGMLQPVGPLDAQDPAIVARAVAVNVGAALMLSAALVRATPHVLDRRILHVSSGAGRNAYAGWSVYCATKAALDHHARAVALDRTAALRICSVAPGVIDTHMQAEIRHESEERFPDRDRFVRMKERGQLLAPGHAAKSLVDFLFSLSFGREPVTDLRYK